MSRIFWTIYKETVVCENKEQKNVEVGPEHTHTQKKTQHVKFLFTGTSFTKL